MNLVFVCQVTNNYSRGLWIRGLAVFSPKVIPGQSHENQAVSKKIDDAAPSGKSRNH